MSEFKLVNPLIGGNLNTKFTAEKSLEAANKAYQSLSQYFKNDVPSFNFTLKNDKNKYFHFNVKEQLKDNEVSFKIKEFKIKTNKNDKFNSFKKQITKFEKKLNQTGSGIIYDEFDYDEDYNIFYDDDDEFFPHKVSRRRYYSNPISYYWYWPSIYDYVLVDKHFKTPLYLPTFVDLLTPYSILYI